MELQVIPMSLNAQDCINESPVQVPAVRQMPALDQSFLSSIKYVIH